MGEAPLAATFNLLFGKVKFPIMATWIDSFDSNAL
jgi:hypothetical protein